jgi:MerR family transcriptional regulator, redox-sensitive transcriptional activator SoxR
MRMTIAEVAREVGLRPSAIRYYEELGVLPAPERQSGQRRYDRSVLYRLAVVQRARQAGFTLEEIRQLFFGFRQGERASARWQKLAASKMEELSALSHEIDTMRQLLIRLQQCPCDSLEQCGRGILERGRYRDPMPTIAGAIRKRRVR